MGVRQCYQTSLVEARFKAQGARFVTYIERTGSVVYVGPTAVK